MVATIPSTDEEILPSSNIEIVFNKPMFLTANFSASLVCGTEAFSLSPSSAIFKDNSVIFPVELPNHATCQLTFLEESFVDSIGNTFLEEVQLTFQTKGKDSRSV